MRTWLAGLLLLYHKLREGCESLLLSSTGLAQFRHCFTLMLLLLAVCCCMSTLLADAPAWLMHRTLPGKPTIYRHRM